MEVRQYTASTLSLSTQLEASVQHEDARTLPEGTNEERGLVRGATWAPDRPNDEVHGARVTHADVPNALTASPACHPFYGAFMPLREH